MRNKAVMFILSIEKLKIHHSKVPQSTDRQPLISLQEMINQVCPYLYVGA